MKKLRVNDVNTFIYVKGELIGCVTKYNIVANGKGCLWLDVWTAKTKGKQRYLIYDLEMKDGSPNIWCVESTCEFCI